TDAQKQCTAEEVAREFAQEQEFFQQSALISKKEKEKIEVMKVVSFMYVRPPCYNTKIALQSSKMREEEWTESVILNPLLMATGRLHQWQQNQPPVWTVSRASPGKKKLMAKDVFGHALPREEEFEVLKSAPHLETGLPARSKPFGVEARNVKCLRCGNFGSPKW
ncbi:hypothetical protein IFM89_038143, partial [Coptis chinensis]